MSLWQPEQLAAYRKHQQRMRELEADGSAHEWAIEWCCSYLVYGWQPEHLVTIEGSGGAMAYHYQTRHGKMLITRFHGKLCHYDFSMRLLVEEARAQLAGVPQQAVLFPTE